MTTTGMDLDPILKPSSIAVIGASRAARRRSADGAERIATGARGTT